MELGYWAVDSEVGNGKWHQQHDTTEWFSAFQFQKNERMTDLFQDPGP